MQETFWFSTLSDAFRDQICRALRVGQARIICGANLSRICFGMSIVSFTSILSLPAQQNCMELMSPDPNTQCIRASKRVRCLLDLKRRITYRLAVTYSAMTGNDRSELDDQLAGISFR